MGYKCDYEHCPGRRVDATKALVYHKKYLLVHRGCLQGARHEAEQRGETFGLRSGI